MKWEQAQIRVGGLADVSALHAIERDVFDLEQLTARSFKRYIGFAGADLVVAIMGGDLVGYGIVSYRRGSVHGRLISIAVTTRASARGIGMALLQHLHGLARTRGMRTMRLEVRRDNLAALSLYRRAGYVATGQKLAYYADFCDAILMQRDLSP